MSVLRLFGLAFSALLFATTAHAQSAPVFTTQPGPAVGALGSHAEFSFRVQVPIASATFGILVFKGAADVTTRFSIVSQTITNTTSGQGSTTAGQYTVRISNLTNADVGSYTFEVTVNGQRSADMTSQPAALMLSLPGAPVITLQPVSRAVNSFSPVTFSVQATGVPPPTYQWYKNGSPITGAAQSSLSMLVPTGFDAGVYHAVATNGAGSVASTTAFLEIVATGRPAIATQPRSVDVVAGQSVTFTVGTTTSPFATTYQWVFNGAVIPGAVNSSYTVTSASTASGGSYSVLVMNNFGSVASAPAVLRILTTLAPVITAQPLSTTVNPGEPVTFTVAASGAPAPTYQWTKNGAAIVGATAASYTVASAQSGDAGAYAVIIANASGSVTSLPATLTIASPNSGRIINLSILTRLDGSADSFTMGYVVGGNGTTGAKPLVIRAAGPSLGALGVPDTLGDPRIELFAGASKTSENDNWGGSASLAAALASVGAFAYIGPASLDAAILADITTRDNSIKVSGTGAGTVIAEIYDATPASSNTLSTPRLLNVSVLKNIGDGLTAGFVIGGTTPKGVLIRAIGPGLTQLFGVTGALADPELILYRAGVFMERNNDWGGTSALTAAFTSVGAFALSPASKDAAVVVMLAPGNYSVQVAGVGNTTGLALVEIYEVP